jgi:hypothetical protein
MVQRSAGSPAVAFLVVGDAPHSGTPAAQSRLPRSQLLRQVARRSFPRLVEATLVPAALFYVALSLFGFGAALGAALTWAYGAMACRWLLHRPIPPILILAVVALTIRTIVAAAAGSAFIYFLQPIVGTTGVAAVFLVSIAAGRPLVGRMATDFCPLAPDVAARPGVVRLFTRLTALWAGINLASAAATFALLVTLPVATFVVTKTITSLTITAVGIVLTVCWSLRTAHHEGLVTPRVQTAALAAPTPMTAVARLT